MNYIGKLKRTLLSHYLNNKCLIENYFYNFQKNDDITEIIPNIYVGNYSTSTNKNLLLENEITHIITIIPSYRPAHSTTFKYIHIDAFDDEYQDLTYRFLETNTFIDSILKEENNRLFINCLNGNNISIVIVLSYLVHLKNEEDKKKKKIYKNMYQGVYRTSHGLSDLELVKINRGLLLHSNDEYKKLITNNPKISQIHPDILLELIDIKSKKPDIDIRDNFLLQLHNCIQLIHNK